MQKQKTKLILKHMESITPVNLPLELKPIWANKETRELLISAFQLCEHSYKRISSRKIKKDEPITTEQQVLHILSQKGVWDEVDHVILHYMKYIETKPIYDDYHATDSEHVKTRCLQLLDEIADKPYYTLKPIDFLFRKEVVDLWNEKRDSLVKAWNILMMFQTPIGITHINPRYSLNDENLYDGYASADSHPLYVLSYGDNWEMAKDAVIKCMNL